MKKRGFILILLCFCFKLSALEEFAWLEQKVASDLQITSSYAIAEGCSIYFADGQTAQTMDYFPALLNKPENIGKDSATVKPVFAKTENCYKASIDFGSAVSIYGGGEVTGSLLRNNTETVLWATDNFTYAKDKGKRLYQTNPWYFGVKKDGSCKGVLFCTTWMGKVKVGNQDVSCIAAKNIFPVIVIEAANPQELMKRFTALTGRIEMPPMWALGYQQCRWSYEPDSRVKEIADTFRAKKIPLDVIWMDIDYMQDFKIFTFDKKKFADPKGLNDYLHLQKVKGIWMIDPAPAKESGYFVYDQGLAKDLFTKTVDGKVYTGRVWPGATVFPDYTMPETTQWWAGLYKDFMATGIDGVWNDMNEPADFDGPDQTMPTSNIHRGGGDIPAGTHLQYHNIYGMLMVKASREGLLNANPEKRPFILSRSNFTGGQRYAAMWTGDNESKNEHMLMAIPMSINIGLCGQPLNGPDIGGFAGILKKDLAEKWFSTGVLFPFARGHAAKGTNNKEPWVFGKNTEDAIRNSIEQRYALLPYYYTLFREAAQTGLPVMRPVFFADPSNTDLRNEENAFLLGNDICVIPPYEKITGRKSNIPAVYSHQLKLNATNTGKQAPILKIRDGAIVPEASIIQSTVDYSVKNLTLHVSLDSQGHAEGVLYDDAHDGFGYKTDEYCEIKFSVDKTAEGYQFKMSKIAGKMEIPVKNISIILYLDSKTVIFETTKESELFNI